MRVYIASDHGGFSLKQELIPYLTSLGHDVVDVGPKEFDPNDDYPDYALPAAQKVAGDENSLGILICRNGDGINIAANKVDGIRAALSFKPDHAKSTRRDDNANVLTLPADYIDLSLAKDTAKTFLETSFSGKERHKRRINKITQAEND